MNKQLKMLTRTVFGMFIVLFFSVTAIQFVYADDLRSNELNQRSTKNSYRIERGSILVQGDPVAYSTPTGDEYQFSRQYASGEMYAPVTGYFSRRQGMTGLEAAMNKELSGLGNAQFLTRVMRTLTGEKPQGNSVETTLDAAAQQAAFQAMQGFKGAAVAIDPDTGRVLALTQSPSFDPSSLSLNSDSQIISNYTALSSDPDEPLVNRAISGNLYHPGSTYKLLTAAAALESGKATPETELANPSSLTLPQSTHVMRNAYGTDCGGTEKVTLAKAMALSCNVPLAELGMSMDRDEVPNMARAFGFEQELSIPLEVTPSISPIPADQAETALASIGQLDVRATPLQMAMVTAGIVNDGVVMKPQLVERVITPDLRTESSFDEQELSNPISASTAKSLQSIMEQAVTSPDGTAVNAAIAGARVGGKTGTAENGEDEPYTLWFTGFAELDGKRVVVAVVIEEGGGEAYGFDGSSAVLPVAVGKQVMEAVLQQ